MLWNHYGCRCQETKPLPLGKKDIRLKGVVGVIAETSADLVQFVEPKTGSSIQG